MKSKVLHQLPIETFDRAMKSDVSQECTTGGEMAGKDAKDGSTVGTSSLSHTQIISLTSSQVVTHIKKDDSTAHTHTQSNQTQTNNSTLKQSYFHSF